MASAAWYAIRKNSPRSGSPARTLFETVSPATSSMTMSSVSPAWMISRMGTIET